MPGTGLSIDLTLTLARDFPYVRPQGVIVRNCRARFERKLPLLLFPTEYASRSVETPIWPLPNSEPALYGVLAQHHALPDGIPLLAPVVLLTVE